MMNKKGFIAVIVVVLGLLAQGAPAGEPGRPDQAKQESVLDYLPAFGSAPKAVMSEPPQSVYVAAPAHPVDPPVVHVADHDYPPDYVEVRQSFGGMVGQFVGWFPRKFGELVTLAGVSVGDVATTGGRFAEDGISALDPTSSE